MFQLRTRTFDIEMKLAASSAAGLSIIIPIQFNTSCYPEDWLHTPHEAVMLQPGAPSPVKDHMRSLID